MTYRYVLLLFGDELDTGDLLSVADVERAIDEVEREGADRDRLIVGRLVAHDGSRGWSGRGVWRVREFLDSPHAGDPDTVYWHRRVRDALNGELSHRNFFIWIDHVRGTGASALDEPAFIAAVDDWLSRVEDGTSDRTEQVSFQWERDTLAVALKALARPTDTRTLDVVGNPEPAIGSYS